MRGSHLSLYKMMGRLLLSVSDSSSRRPPVAQPLTRSQHRSCGLKSRRHFSVVRSCWEALLTLPLAVRYLQVLSDCRKLYRIIREKNKPCLTTSQGHRCSRPRWHKAKSAVPQHSSPSDYDEAYS